MAYKNTLSACRMAARIHNRDDNIYKQGMIKEILEQNYGKTHKQYERFRQSVNADHGEKVDTLTERVYETLNYFLQEYYDNYDPKSYWRQDGIRKNRKN